MSRKDEAPVILPELPGPLFNQQLLAIKNQIMARLPDSQLFEQDIDLIFSFDRELGRRIFNAISQFFYVAYDRQPYINNDSFSILHTIEYESRTGEKIQGVDHKVKAACTFNCLNKAITAINSAISQYPEQKELLEKMGTYLIALKGPLGHELKHIEDSNKRQEIKEKTGLDLDTLKIKVFGSPERKIVKTFHGTPPGKVGNKTPPYLKDRRVTTQRRMADNIAEGKYQNQKRPLKRTFDETKKPKAVRKTGKGFAIFMPSKPSMPQGGELPSDHTPINFSLRPTQQLKVKLFTDRSSPTKRRKVISAEAEASGIELGHK